MAADIPTPQDIQALQQEAAALEQVAASAEKAHKATGKLPDDMGKYVERIDNLIKSGGKVSPTMERVYKSVKDAASAFEESAKQATKFFDSLTDGQFSISKIIENVRKWSANHEELIGSLKRTYVQIDAFRNNVFATVDSFKTMEQEVKGSASLIADFGNEMSKILSDEKILGGTGAAFAPYVKNFTDAISATTAFETSLLRATTAGGSTGAMLSYIGREGESLQDNLGQAMTATINRAKDLGISTGIGFKESMIQVMMVMQNLPRELNKVYNVLDDRNVDYALNTEQLLSKAAAGVGVKTEKAIEIAGGMFNTFGANALEASKRLAIMGDASKDLQIPFESIDGLIKGLDTSFSLWGDQAKGTIDILRNVSSALDGSGVGFKGQISIVQNLTGAFEKMSLGMKSFIGVQAGLRGGAVSAGLQIERMMQEGKMGELASMMQQTLEKRTGRGAVTLAQATESPQSQAVFLQQRALLQTMGVSGVDAQNRLLETMSKVQIGAVSGKDAGEAFKNALSKGDSIQEKQSVDIAVIKDNTEKAVTSLSMISAATVGREVFSGTAFGKMLKDEIRSRQGKEDSGQENFEKASERVMGNLISAQTEAIPLATKAGAAIATTIGNAQKDISNALKKDSGKQTDEKPNFFMGIGETLRKKAIEQEEALHKPLEAPTPKAERPKPILQQAKTSLSQDELNTLQQEIVNAQPKGKENATLAISKLASTSLEDFEKTKTDLISGTIAAYNKTVATLTKIYGNNNEKSKSLLDEAATRAQQSIDSIKAITPESLPKTKLEKSDIESVKPKEEIKVNIDYKKEPTDSLNKIREQISSELKRATPADFEEKKTSLREGFLDSYKENLDKIKQQYEGTDKYNTEVGKLDKMYNPIMDYLQSTDSTKLADISTKIPTTKRPALNLGEPTAERMPTLRQTTMEATASQVKTEVQGEVAVNITIYSPEGQNLAQSKIIGELVKRQNKDTTRQT